MGLHNKGHCCAVGIIGAFRSIARSGTDDKQVFALGDKGSGLLFVVVL